MKTQQLLFKSQNQTNNLIGMSEWFNSQFRNPFVYLNFLASTGNGKHLPNFVTCNVGQYPNVCFQTFDQVEHMARLCGLNLKPIIVRNGHWFWSIFKWNPTYTHIGYKHQGFTPWWQ